MGLKTGLLGKKAADIIKSALIYKERKNRPPQLIVQEGISLGDGTVVHFREPTDEEKQYSNGNVFVYKFGVACLCERMDLIIPLDLEDIHDIIYGKLPELPYLLIPK